MMSVVVIIIEFVLLWCAVVVHEVAHGWVAYRLGDATAYRLGRLSLNPIKHMDVVGSFLVPGLCWVSGAPLFGWAKPVPVQCAHFKRPQWDMMWVALAGPLSNFMMMVLGIWVLSFFKIGYGDSLGPFVQILWVWIQLNFVLMVFNLIPIPPLDGSRILYPFLPGGFQVIWDRVSPYGILLVFGLVYMGFFSFVMQLMFQFFLPLLMGFIV